MAEKKSSFADATPGDIFCVVRYVRLDRKDADKAYVTNIGGEPFNMSSHLLETEYYSAKQFTREEARTRGEIAKLLENAGETVFTVAFTKQPDANAVADLLTTLPDDPRSMSQAKRRKLAREQLLVGELRELIGCLQTHDALDEFGRIVVRDLEKNERRVVDPRTISWLIYKGVKYTIK